ncbi:hypothetical protein ACFW6E_39135 [Streptomyces olivaceoviridis]|uniref:hypothetical protein n=1 Tax=Streptomyces olivaceoviridis TaxID=1921 RepID=UPI00368A3E9E
MTDLHEPWEPLDSYPDESPPPRQFGDVNLVGLLSVADDLARSLATLKIRVRPHDPKTPLVSPEKAREKLGRCVLGADSNGGCSTEGANLQLNVWDDTTRRDIVDDGTTGCVAHSVDLGDDVTARIRLGATPDVVVGSVHAVSGDGVLPVGSASGSRLARTHRVPARRSGGDGTVPHPGLQPAQGVATTAGEPRADHVHRQDPHRGARSLPRAGRGRPDPRHCGLPSRFPSGDPTGPDGSFMQTQRSIPQPPATHGGVNSPALYRRLYLDLARVDASACRRF